jgi:K+-sensing histidine kinase KdpD
LIRIADEEVRHLKELIDDSLELARLDSSDIHVQRESSNMGDIVHEVVASMQREIDHRPLKWLRRDSAEN